MGFFNDSAQVVDKIVTVIVVGKYFTTFDAADDNVMQGPGGT